MAATENKFILNLPLKIIFTESGSSYFISRKKRLLRFRLADNADEYGISVNKFSPRSIQDMILLDYISKIEISMTEFVSSRQEVMDLSKVIVYSILYKQFDRKIYEAIIHCSCVRKYNRANPAHIIDEKTSISGKQLQLTLSSQNDIIEKLRKAILAPIWKSVMENKEFSIEEKNIYLLMTEKFLNRLGLMNWYIITLFHKTEGFDEMLQAVRALLKEYMEKSKVAEYISVMVMELALNSENSNVRKEARKMYQGIDKIDALIFDADIREKIIKELQRKGELVFLTWKLGGGASSIGRQGRLQVTLYNKDDEFQEIKETIEAGKTADTRKKSLVDFYREQPEGQEGIDLGLYYLSYLDDACKKVGVKFESLVNQFSTSDLTVINLVFNF
ncbi:MAG: hypothetical protein J6I73_03660 [Treponema sp.]|nr:hypothetical protein [Treponema sp.]